MYKFDPNCLNCDLSIFNQASQILVVCFDMSIKYGHKMDLETLSKLCTEAVHVEKVI